LSIRDGGLCQKRRGGFGLFEAAKTFCEGIVAVPKVEVRLTNAAGIDVCGEFLGLRRKEDFSEQFVEFGSGRASLHGNS